VVVAHNEADRIGARIENLLAQDYPAECLEIVIGSDGSTDATVQRARAFASSNVVVRAFSARRGKPAVLNAIVPSAGGEIIVFADARQRFHRQTLRALLENFADPEVGAVSGSLILTTDPSATASDGAGFYWKYETFIRSMESRGGSMVGATGAIYAIRRDLFEPIPDDTILDDVLIPLQISRAGYRVVFEPAARAYDVAASSGCEFARKARTIAGNFQLFARELWLFNPRRNPLWFETLSHKALRLSIPVLHVGLIAANLALLEWWVYRWTLLGQAAFYGAALAGFARGDERRGALLTVPYAMCLLGWATVVGFFRFMTGRQQVTWERVPISVSAASESADRAA